MLNLGGSYALAEGHPFYVVDDIPMGCDLLIGYDQMRHSKRALMWSADTLLLVPQSVMKWSWLKSTNVPLSPHVKPILGYRQPKPRAKRGNKRIKKRHKPRRTQRRAAGGASDEEAQSDYQTAQL
ncbi:hypothetical protein SARC_06725 [Sphaeroforma arctica JP610]|uniref:Uncharacterized protein n=1 Tax=Sphaeroforma arctica JP610 TaxID=667725 RepID=A0A0L0FVS1_9EUKA|nr:hypothetical protein SARC_06725 [Sphaeroforma arctica JP610]KNC80937.1 hypothetical protein SARC_06725 [Sphaeroforma arctica JP610]|eukprot:XP_014154839.1 hypothetical protein SARC_06725 [Sphaeroforma arctica JP610]